VINVDEVNDQVLTDIANNMGLDVGEDATYDAIRELSFESAWERFCVWNGLLGSFHIKLREAYESLKKASK